MLSFMLRSPVLASFPGPAQLSVACSTEKRVSSLTLSFRFFVRARGEPGNEATPVYDLAISLVLTTFSEYRHAQEMCLCSPDCFSLRGTCGLGIRLMLGIIS